MNPVLIRVASGPTGIHRCVGEQNLTKMVVCSDEHIFISSNLDKSYVCDKTPRPICPRDRYSDIFFLIPELHVTRVEYVDPV